MHNKVLTYFIFHQLFGRTCFFQTARSCSVWPEGLVTGQAGLLARFPYHILVYSYNSTLLWWAIVHLQLRSFTKHFFESDGWNTLKGLWKTNLFNDRKLHVYGGTKERSYWENNIFQVFQINTISQITNKFYSMLSICVIFQLWHIYDGLIYKIYIVTLMTK